MAEPGRPLILVRRKPHGGYTQDDTSGKVTPTGDSPLPDTSGAVLSENSQERFSSAGFSRDDREIAPTGKTFPEVSYPPHPETGAHLLAMPLDVFAREGQPLEVRVPWLDLTLWMVPTDRDAARLIAEGVSRGRIWTAAELIQIMQLADRTPEVVKTLTHAKLELDGEITEVRPRSDASEC